MYAQVMNCEGDLLRAHGAPSTLKLRHEYTIDYKQIDVRLQTSLHKTATSTGPETIRLTIL
jgi:hypothetical protein